MARRHHGPVVPTVDRLCWMRSVCAWFGYDIGSSNSRMGLSESQARARFSRCARPSDDTSRLIQLGRTERARRLKLFKCLSFLSFDGRVSTERQRESGEARRDLAGPRDDFNEEIKLCRRWPSPVAASICAISQSALASSIQPAGAL